MPTDTRSRNKRRRAVSVAGAFCGLVMSAEYATASDSTQPPPWPAQAERSAATVFISGHSLTDRPIPDHLEKIALSLGSELAWNRQYVVGSDIQRRTRGSAAGETGWSGYRQGYNKDGEGMDVVAELRSPKTTGGKRYDTLLITEVRSILGALLWSDTVRTLRHYHDLFISANPEGRTYFYESWLGILDKSAPQRWIAYEREASPIWQCVAARINLSLQHADRTDRITPLPAGLALVELVERATQAQGVPGVTAGSVRETIDGLVADDVHLTPRGSYYLALVTYAAIYRRSPVGAWAPDGVDATQAASMQKIAWEFISNFYARSRPEPLAECRARILDRFSDIYWSYVNDSDRKIRGTSLLQSARDWFAQRRRSQLTTRTFSARDASNPLHFSPETDRDYWHRPL